MASVGSGLLPHEGPVVVSWYLEWALSRKGAQAARETKKMSESHTVLRAWGQSGREGPVSFPDAEAENTENGDASVLEMANRWRHQKPGSKQETSTPLRSPPYPAPGLSWGITASLAQLFETGGIWLSAQERSWHSGRDWPRPWHLGLGVHLTPSPMSQNPLLKHLSLHLLWNLLNVSHTHAVA